jgi:hypothetical protein
VFSGIIVGVLLLIVGPPISTYLYPPEPKIEIDIDRIGTIALDCRTNTYSSEDIEFTVQNLGEPSTSLSYYYKRLTRINNTCVNSTYFFDSSKAMCLLEYIDDNQQLSCKSKTPTLGKGDHQSIRYYFSTEASNFLDRMRNVSLTSRCYIQEEIILGASFGGKSVYSAPRKITIEYTPC